MTSIGKFTAQLTELRNQFEHMKDATLGEIGALQNSFSDLISAPAELVSEQIGWAGEFQGEARRIVDGVEQMGRSGRSIRETWREALQNADRLTDGDLPRLLADQPPEAIAQAVADFQRQRERADKRLVMEHTVADAAAHLSGAVGAAQASLDRLRNDSNKSHPRAGGRAPALVAVAEVHLHPRDPARPGGGQSHGHRHHLSAGGSGAGHRSRAMIRHLQNRDKRLEPFGWKGSEAEWIALVCLHSGVFTRAQFRFYLNAGDVRALRFVRALIERGVAAENTVPGIGGVGRICRIFGRRIYRALGAEDIRHRRIASPEVLLRRLLSLDYVLEHPECPWLPTETEKVRCFDALGVGRQNLPRRVYRGAVGETRRYFALKLPIAVEEDKAIFVYVDPGHATDTELRSWAAAHRGLWDALRTRGLQVQVAAVARGERTLERAETVLKNWAGGSGPVASAPDPSAAQEIARIEQAILQGAIRVLNEFGGLQAAMKRSVELKKLNRQRSGRKIIDTGFTWRTARLLGFHFGG